jgi:hypothetical protein
MEMVSGAVLAADDNAASHGQVMRPPAFARDEVARNLAIPRAAAL